MTIIDALNDRKLFGALGAFRKLATWRAWLVFLRATYGLPIEGDDLDIFRRSTGRSEYRPPPGGWREVVAVVARQSGKTRVAALLAAFEAATAPPETDGTTTYALLIAQDQRGALRTLFQYARAPFDRVPILRESVVSRRADTVTLTSNCVLAVYPCRPQSVRGVRARVAVVDEIAFFRSSEGYPTDVEMLRAIRPTTATTGGKVVILSSPYGMSGALFDLHRLHFGRDDSSTLVWQASAPDMNPTLPDDYLRRMAQDDPEAYRSEVLGEFRAGLSTLLDPDALASVVATGVRERAPHPGTSYVGFADPSGGRSDAFTIAIAHRLDDRAVLDVVRSWPAPFDPSAVVAEASDLLRTYGLSRVVGDRYAGEFTVSAFRATGIMYEPSERNRSALYLELLPLVNAGRVELLDDPELLRQLRGLERQRGSSGRDRVDHAPGGHDDVANCAAGALGLAATAGPAMTMTMAYELMRDSPPPAVKLLRAPWAGAAIDRENRFGGHRTGNGPDISGLLRGMGRNSR